MIGLIRDWTTNHTFDRICGRKYKFSEWMRAKFVCVEFWSLITFFFSITFHFQDSHCSLYLSILGQRKLRHGTVAIVARVASRNYTLKSRYGGSTSVRICFGSPFSSKVVVCGQCLVTLSLTIMKH